MATTYHMRSKPAGQAAPRALGAAAQSPTMSRGKRGRGSHRPRRAAEHRTAAPASSEACTHRSASAERGTMAMWHQLCLHSRSYDADGRFRAVKLQHGPCWACTAYIHFAAKPRSDSTKPRSPWYLELLYLKLWHCMPQACGAIVMVHLMWGQIPFRRDIIVHLVFAPHPMVLYASSLQH